MVSFVSINHNSIHLFEREKLIKNFSFNEQVPHVKLQTCNRLEIYSGEGEISSKVYNHLFRVVAGLESSLTGESAIQGQVKAAYEDARRKFKLSPALHDLFQQTLRVGKRVRSESKIGTGAMSHAMAVVEMLSKMENDFSKLRFTLVGVNKLNEDVIKFLSKKGAVHFTIVNRTYRKAQDLAAKYNAMAVEFDKLVSILSSTDVLISATSSEDLILKKSDLYNPGNLIIFDLAFPRDIDPEIGVCKNIQLFNLQELERIIMLNRRIRQKEVILAEKIISEEISKLCQVQVTI